MPIHTHAHTYTETIMDMRANIGIYNIFPSFEKFPVNILHLKILIRGLS